MDVRTSEVTIPVDGVELVGDLLVPDEPAGMVFFAHGSGSSRHSPRNRRVAHLLHGTFLGTLLVDLLTVEEEQVDELTAELRFDIGLLADRLTGIVDWLATEPSLGRLPLGLFGASTGAAGALVAAADRPDQVRAVVSRGGRPDLAGDALARVRAPSLLLVGGLDRQVLELNESALAALDGNGALEVVPGATHLFEEPGTLDEVAHRAGEWFADHLH